MSGSPLFEVFIPSRGTAAAVERVHRHIARPLAPVAVTLVLNPSANGVVAPAVLQRCRDLGMTPTICRGGGTSRARNVGLKLASAPVVVFLDDDVIATPDAVDGLVAGLRRQRACVATGRVLAAPSSHRSDELWSSELAFDRGPAAAVWTTRDAVRVSPFDVWQFGVGAAFAVDRARMHEQLDRVPRFDERLSNGRFAGGTEDVDYFYAVYVAGGAVAYVSQAIFGHKFPARRRDIRAKCRQYAIADGAFYAKWRGRADRSDIVSEIHGWRRRLAGHVGARARGRPAVPLRSLLAEPAYKVFGALTWSVRCRSSS